MKIKSTLKLIALLFFFAYFSGCASIPSLQERQHTLQTIIDTREYKSETISTTDFNLLTVKDKHIEQCVDQSLKVYIEGDGLSWATKHTISDNPTPINPLGLKLMMLDDDPCKIYLARPCQYISTSTCRDQYWTSHRFDPKVINSYEEALDQLQQTYHNRSFTLIGYSGGAAVAILTAVKRNDVKKIVTIAGNVDTTKWVELHNLNPLDGSLNPADYAKQVEQTEQIHLIGFNDTVVPQGVFFSYLSRFTDQSHITYKLMDATHSKNWEINYKMFLDEKREH